jgi:hypothetical protein
VTVPRAMSDLHGMPGTHPRDHHVARLEIFLALTARGR